MLSPHKPRILRILFFRFLILATTIFAIYFAYININRFSDNYLKEHPRFREPKNSKILRRMNDADQYEYLEAYSNKIFKHMLFDFQTKNVDLTNSSIDEIDKLQQLCTYYTGYEPDRIYISKAFNCLAKIDLHKYKENDNIYKAIKNSSHSLEVAYLPENLETLSKDLTIGYEDVLPEKFRNLVPYFTGLKEDEVAILKELINLDIPEISARANYRLSLIHTLGRSSVKESINHNLRLAIEELHNTIKLSNIKAYNMMNVAIVIDDNFSKYAASVIASALLNSDLTTFYHFYIIMDSKNPVSSDSQQKLASMNWIRDYKITFIPFSEELNVKEITKKAELCHAIREEFPPIVSQRLYIDKLMPPEIDKILYLDADIIVLKDLTYFKQLDMENYFIAAIADMGMILWPRENCSYTFREFYVNSGVVYFNLDKMRKENSLNMMIEAINNCKTCNLSFVDQDILNLTFEEYIYFISPRWNDVMDHRYYKQLVPHPISFIQHYAGLKPWMFTKEIFKKSPERLSKESLSYWRYEALTPWTDQ